MTRTPLTPLLTEARRANIRRLLAPQHLAFVGGGVAEAAVHCLRAHNFKGEVYVVNPKREKIAGLRCYTSLDELPVAPDAVYLGVPADATVETVAELNRLGTGAVVCYASGFSEIGEAGAERNTRLVEAAGDMAVVGPNCFGMVNYVTDASMWTAPYRKSGNGRGAAIIGQSGNICIHLSSNDRSVPFSYLISAGNQAILGFEDYIDVLVDDPNVTAIGLFMEGIRDVVAFSKACLRARSKGIPVVVCRSGRSELGAALAASHTSSLAGQNEYFEALFARLGVLETETIPQFLECLKLASIAPLFEGRRAAFFSSSGGDNGLAADYCAYSGVDLPAPCDGQVRPIAELLPDYAHVSNPLDFTAGYWGNEAVLTPMFTQMLEGAYDFGVVVLDHPPTEFGPEAGEPVRAMIRSIAAAGKTTGKPVAMASVNPESIPVDVRDWMQGIGVVPLQGLHDATKVLGLWATHSENLRRDAASGRLPEAPFALPKPETGTHTVNEAESKRRLAVHGLTVPEGQVLTRTEIDKLPEQLDQPLVLKVLHDQLAHKTEVGGVTLNLGTRAEVAEAADRMIAKVRGHAPGIVLNTFLLEPMQEKPLAEVIIGVKRDPLFGLMLVIGAGGIFVEILKDAQTLLLPASREEIEETICGLRSFALLDGFRGRTKADTAAIVDAVEAIAAYATEARETLMELDVNPLMVYADRVVAVDALIVETG